MIIGIARWFAGLFLATVAMVLILSGAARAQTASGDWHGLLTTPGVPLRIGVSIAAQPGGALSGILTSPDQTSQPFPLAEVKADAATLSFAVPVVQGRYAGKWDAAARAWVGEWKQLGSVLALTLEQGPVPPLARTQPPAKPYPYGEVDVAFDSAPQVRLAGTLTVPPGKGPFPAAVLITGSGPQNRDEELLGHKPFLVLADHLTRQRIAVLRYDDRGVARSTGKFGAATTEDFTTDALAAVAFLRTRPEIDARRIGLVGHSEGGMIAPMAAVRDPKVAYVVMIAGPGTPSRQLMADQRRAVMTTMGAKPDEIERSLALSGQLDRAVIAAKDPAEARQALTRLLNDAGSPEKSPAALTEAQISQLSTPWYRYFIAYNPAPVLARVRQPILAVNGSKDVQVIASQNLSAIRAATKANGDVTIVELPGLNHLLQTAPTGAPSEYGTIAETMSPKALETISNWIVAHTRR